jgi:hypothetical protein
MGKKLLVSLAMEGKFIGEGLQSLDDGADMLTAMAKELVTDGRIGESADTIWRQLRVQQELTSNGTGMVVTSVPTSEPAFLSQPGLDANAVDDAAAAKRFEQLALF